MTIFTLSRLNTIELDHPAEPKCVQVGRFQVKPDVLAQHNIPETIANIDQVKEASHDIFKDEISNPIAIANSKSSHSSHTTVYRH